MRSLARRWSLRAGARRWSLRARVLAVLVALLALVSVTVGVVTVVALRDQLVGQRDRGERVVAHTRESLRQVREDARPVVPHGSHLAVGRRDSVDHTAVPRHDPLHPQADPEHGQAEE